VLCWWISAAAPPISPSTLTTPNDIATVLYLPEEEAERIKIEYGHANPEMVPLDQIVTIQTFGEVQPTPIQAYDLANIIEARVEELFTLILKEVKRSGYDGLLSAGVVLTGGTASLPGIRETATRVMNLPVRVAIPENITGLADRLRKPDFATSVGLLHAASPDDLEDGPETPPPARRRPDSGSGGGSGGSGSSGGSGGEGPQIGKALTDFLGRLLPDD
jgi:cell division protein FtsA